MSVLIHGGGHVDNILFGHGRGHLHNLLSRLLPGPLLRDDRGRMHDLLMDLRGLDVADLLGKDL
eukprot:1330175-Alexandrium_andersonii.AAC.1